MNNPLTGNGFKFPILPDANGKLSFVSGDENIEQSLRILFLTNLGERVMRPDFGCNAPKLLFFPGSVQNLQLLENTLREAVIEWEPRVELEEVRAEVTPGDETRVIVNISYRVRRTNTRQNLVFPFYLGTLEGA